MTLAIQIRARGRKDAQTRAVAQSSAFVYFAANFPAAETTKLHNNPNHSRIFGPSTVFTHMIHCSELKNALPRVISRKIKNKTLSRESIQEKERKNTPHSQAARHENNQPPWSTRATAVKYTLQQATTNNPTNTKPRSSNTNIQESRADNNKNPPPKESCVRRLHRADKTADTTRKTSPRNAG